MSIPPGKFSTTFLGFVAILSCTPNIAQARQTTVTGGITAGYEYWTRDYNDSSETQSVTTTQSDTGQTQTVPTTRDDRQEWSIGPDLTVSSLGARSSLSLRYAPSLTYYDDGDTYVDHALDAEGSLDLRNNWKVALNDRFIYSDDPTRGTSFSASREQGQAAGTTSEPPTPTPASDELTRDQGRLRYWTNMVSAKTAYVYARESGLNLGYIYEILRNDSGDDNFAEYDRHTGFGSVLQRFDAYWSALVSGSYTQGNQESLLREELRRSDAQLSEEQRAVLNESDDIQEATFVADLRYDQTDKNTYSALYGYVESRYDSSLQPDIRAHRLTLSWKYAFRPHSVFELGAGPTYYDSDDLDGEWSYNAHASYTEDFERSTFKISFEKATQNRNFTGSDRNGVVDRYSADINYTHHLTGNLSGTIFGTYNRSSYLNPTGEYYDEALRESGNSQEGDIGDVTYDITSYEAGLSLTGNIKKWLTASLNYSYYHQDGDLTQDSYADNTIFIQLTARQDLWKN